MKSGARVRLDSRGHRDGRDRHDRHRHRQLHHHRPDRGRDDGRAARQGRRCGSAIRAFRSRPAPAASGAGNSSTAGVYAACVKLREAVAQKLGLECRRRRLRRRPGASRDRAACRWPRWPATRGLVAEDSIEFGDLAKKFAAVDLRRALRRGRRRCRHRRDPRPPHARRLRRRPHPQPQDGAQPGDRRDDDGRGRGADGGAGRRHAPRLLRQPRPRRLRGAGACGHPAPGSDLPGRDRPDVVADEGQGRRRARHLRRAAAVANAIYNATGVRVRDYPITLDKVLAGMPSVA